ncbi:hypothetical protein ABXJ76_10205 [Methylobacter sp. G7]|uniref:hypothetical protein n=1 Tax=Methylobacter sp. G7 TaxID=3230117 RepID=UPI003D807157
MQKRTPTYYAGEQGVEWLLIESLPTLSAKLRMTATGRRTKPLRAMDAVISSLSVIERV